MKTIDHIPRGYKMYHCANGKQYVAPKKSCLFCAHCTDIFYDFTNGPYMWYCDVVGNPENHFTGCHKFKKGE